MMLNGVSLLLLGNVDTTSFGISLASSMASNKGKASSKIGSLVLLRVLFLICLKISFLCKQLDKEGAFLAVKVSGLLYLINPSFNLVLV